MESLPRVASSSRQVRKARRARVKMDILCRLEMRGGEIKVHSSAHLMQSLGISYCSTSLFKEALGSLRFKHRSLTVRRESDSERLDRTIYRGEMVVRLANRQA